MTRPTFAYINLDAIRDNYIFAQSLVPNGQCLAVVKANAYGHGAVAVAKALVDLVPAFGVACIEEANELRLAGIKKPILLLEGVFSAEEIIEAANNNYWIMVERQEQVTWLLNAQLTQSVRVWLKIDTGMHRLGISPETVELIYASLLSSPNVNNEIVIATHLACADEVDNPFTQQQLYCFKEAVAKIDAPLSIANSPGLLAWPETRKHWSRPGYMLYGNTPFALHDKYAERLRAAMTFKSTIISVRDVAIDEIVGYAGSWVAQRPSRIATVAVGYGDGYPRHAPNGTPVLVNNKRVGLVGRVSMDMITIDVTDLTSVNIGDEVILWGEELTVNEVAKSAETIGYEILARMPQRTPRVYV